MDALFEMTGSGIPVPIGGKTYILSTLKAKHWGEAARALNALRKAPLDIVKQHLPGLSVELQKHLLDLAYRDERDGELLPQYEITRWFRTEEGAVWKFWAQIRQEHPEVTLELAEQLLRTLDAEQAARVDAAGKANEALPQGNSCGQAQPTAETTTAVEAAAAEVVADPSHSPGAVPSAN